MIKNLSFLGAILLMLSFSSCSEENEDIQPSQQENAELKQWDASTGYLWGNNRTNGWNGNKYWTVYKDGGWGKMTFPSGGNNFQLDYGNNNDIVGGKGWNKGATWRKINYRIGYQYGAFDFAGAYGWVRASGRIIEYYVNDRPHVGGGHIWGHDKGKNFESDGRYYKLLTRDRHEVTAYGLGKQHFTQFISEHIGDTGTNSDQTISMQNHFNQWGWNGGHGSGWHDWLYQIFGAENFGGGNGGINASVW